MLAAMALQVTFGLFAVDIDGLESGPLSYLVSFDQGRVAAELHEVTFNILLALISIHLLAVLYYAVFKRKDLIRRMITGKTTQLHDASEPVEPASTARFALAVAISTAITWAVSKGFTF